MVTIIKKIALAGINLLHEIKTATIGFLFKLPFLLSRRSIILAGPHTMGYGGGVWNPGAVFHKKQIILLAKGHYLSWWKAHGDKKNQYLKGNPVLLYLKEDGNEVKNIAVIDKVNCLPADTALGDMRMFEFQGAIFVNHSLPYLKDVGMYFSQVKVTAALSKLDIEKLSLDFVGEPRLDFITGKIEKNWMYVEQNNSLLLFYSVNPFRVLRTINNNILDYKTFLNTTFSALTNPGGFGTMVSFSTNPVSYDKNSFLIIIHQIEKKLSGRCYHHWGVLVDKKTAIPQKITRKPIFSGMSARGRAPGIRYISSILIKNQNIFFFAGEGDIYTTVIKKNKTDLEQELVKI